MRITLSAGLALALIVPLAAAPAHARERAAWVKVDPDPVLIHGDRSTWITVSATIDDPNAVYDAITAEMRPVNEVGYNYALLKDPDGDGVYTGRRKIDPFDVSPGKWRIEIVAIAADGSGEVQGPKGFFSIKGATRLSAKAAPQKVRKGGAFVFSGRLTGVETFDGGWTPYPKMPVKIYFQRAGTAEWVYAAQVKTNSEGRFTKSFRPKKSGSWKAVYAGSAKYLASSKTVRVTLR